MRINKTAMKRKIYYSPEIEEILNVISKSERHSAAEHEFLQRETMKEDSSKEGFLRERLHDKINKISEYEFLIPFIKENKLKKIISLGSGDGIFEYLLKLCLPKDYIVASTDYDSFLVEKTKEYFPEIISEKFDFFYDKFEILIKEIELMPDLVIFMNSSYIMNDEEFINLFTQLRDSKVKTIIDIYPSYIGAKEYIYFLFKSLLEKFNSNHSSQLKRKFHGFSRSKKELKNLYKKSGYSISSSYYYKNTKFIAVLKSSD